MRDYQFTVCVTLDDGFVMPIERLITPIVVAESFGAAISKAEIVTFCTENKCSIFREVRRW